jgi:hypothetical protein
MFNVEASGMKQNGAQICGEEVGSINPHKQELLKLLLLQSPDSVSDFRGLFFLLLTLFGTFPHQLVDQHFM